MNDSDKAMTERLELALGQEPVQATWILFNPLALLLWLAPAAVALFAPLDVLDRFPFAASVVDNMLHFLPALRGHAAATLFPQVALLHATLVLLFLGPLTLLYWAYWHYGRWRNLSAGMPDRFRRDRKVVWIGSALSIVFALGLFLKFSVLHGDWSVTPGLTTESRVGLAVIFGIWMWGAAFCTSVTLSYCFTWLLGASPNGKDDE